MTSEEVYRAFRIAYDGRPFHGFQRQPDQPTVEDALFAAFRELDNPIEPVDGTGYAAAGRTDAGVSARAQTITVTCPAWLDPAALNSELPSTVRAWAFRDVDTGFHPQYDAIERSYTYFLHASGIDPEKASAVCERLVGTHDFHNLTAEAGDTRRTITAVSVESAGPFLELDIRAPGFLREQVRRIATLVREIATGSRSEEALDRVLNPDPLPGPEGVQPAPPEPLVLTDVVYEDLSFEIDEPAADRAATLFREAAIHHAGIGRVLGRIGSSLE